MGDKLSSKREDLRPSGSHETLGEEEEEDIVYEEIVDDIDADEDDNELEEALALLVTAIISYSIALLQI